MDFGEDLSLLEVIVILGIVGGILYFGYQWIQKVTNDPANIDPSTGLSNGPVNGIMQSIVPESFPGGGASGSETYTGAASEIILHPIDSLFALFGGTPPDAAAAAPVPYAAGQNPNLESGAF